MRASPRTLELTASLKATLEQRLEELARAPTLHQSPSTTFRPEARSVDAWTRPDPSRLPRISLAAAGASLDPEASTHGDVADLELGPLLGEGGMGRVFGAFQRSLARDVAIKTLRTDAEPAAKVTLLREAVITGSLEHPGIVPVHALGLDASGDPILVMKRIEGITWADLLGSPEHAAWAARGSDPFSVHVQILMQLCLTIEFAHTRGILHRDIKLENIMLGDFGETYLVDWGVAVRLAPASQPGGAGFAGTPAYMAPEMVAGGPLDERTDVFLLGATLHEALTGTTRNAGESISEVLASALMQGPFDYGSDIPEELAAICNRATARDPSERFATARALRDALGAYLEHRDSIRLTRDAAQRLTDLEELIAAAGADAPPSDLPRAYRLGTETRFAYVEALRGWSKNAEASCGLARCLACLVDLELRQGHIETARALLGELEAPPEELVARLDRAQLEREKRQAEERRLRALAKSMDMTPGRLQRKIALGLFVACATGLFLAVLLRGASGFTVERLVHVAGSLVAVVGLVVIVQRRYLLGSAFNRRMSAVAFTFALALLVSRSVALVQHFTVRDAVTQDLLVLSMMTAVLTLTSLRSLWPAIPVLLAALVGCIVMPGRALLVYAVAVVALPAVAFVAFGRREPDPRDPPLR